VIFCFAFPGLRPKLGMQVLPEERYRSLFEHAPLGFLVADRSGKITAMNSTLISLFGLESSRGRANIFTNARLKKAGISANFRFCLKRESRSSPSALSQLQLSILRAILPDASATIRKIAGIQAVVINATAKKKRG